jgi:LPXTG-motif cell wall-anchored protein
MRAARGNIGSEGINKIITVATQIVTQTISVVSAKIGSERAEEFESEIADQKAKLQESENELAMLNAESAKVRTQQTLILVGGGLLLLGGLGGIVILKKRKEKA